jgi:membrane protease YdiL (CAAX protease family)
MVYVLWLLASVYIYISLSRQITARPIPASDGTIRSFGVPEAVLALILISFLMLNVVAAVQTPDTPLNERSLVGSLILTVAVILILFGFLKLRGFSIDALAGLNKFGLVRAIGTGGILLLFAYPLVNLADMVTQRVLGGDSSKQNIVELFNGSRTMSERVLIIVLAVAIAPMAEELVFRFFIYGVLKRYGGRIFGLAFNALLFAAVHAHLPSFLPLFVLAACFTLAYEWSGSILVSMTMHSIFNSLSLLFLAYPDSFQR